MSGHSHIIRGDTIIDKDTGGIIVAGGDRSEERDYAVVVKCGHSGRGFYTPIMFSVRARNIEDAKQFALQTQRVKRDEDGAVLICMEVSHEEALLIETINDHDPFLRSARLDGDDGLIVERRIVEEYIVEANQDQRFLDKMNRDKRKKVEDHGMKEFKTADDYHESYVLQRAFAPILRGGKYVCKRTVNKRDLLDEYLFVQTIRLGFKGKKTSVVSLYLQIYGPDNPLGIRYKNGVISYKYNGEVVKMETGEKIANYIETAFKKFDTKKKYIETVEEIESIDKVAAPRVSALDRFNARLAKTKALQDRDKK
ncbi:MAG: hypothetical protein IJX00_02040 [Clostridia bacterium]|nr:hypothetical protein [Clostridia bacterium]